MAEDKGCGGQGESLFSVMAQTLNSIDGKRGDLPGMVAVLALFNLFNIVSLVQETGVAGGGSGINRELLGPLMGMLAGGGKPGPEMLLDLLQKQGGKKLNPQLLASLLSLLGDAKGPAGGEGGDSKPKAETPQEKRPARGLL